MTTDSGSSEGRSSGALLGRALIAVVWLGLMLLAAAAGLELFLKVKPHPPSPRPRYDRLTAAYAPFTVQHVNPQYLFFFPFDARERESINNEVCSVGPEGFRGPGPERAGGRKLAFVLGGSALFGHFATSDATTIPGYLNSIQSEYFFVNAGVPSWNTTQELFRLVHQILRYQPSLIVAYDAANDIAISLDYQDKGLSFPAGTPESFDQLSALIDDIRGQGPRTRLFPWYERIGRRLFPRLTSRLHARLAAAPAEPPHMPLPEAVLDDTVRVYLYDIELMHDIAQARGARFIGIFQPILWLHRHLGESLHGYEGEDAAPDYRAFHRRVMADAPAFEFLDYASLFDSRYEAVPAYDRKGPVDVTDDAIFLDPVHLSDRGNRIVAEELARYLASSARGPAAP